MPEYDVYLSSPLRLRKLNEQICTELETLGLRVYLPLRDTDQSASSSGIFQSNLGAIDRSRLVLAVINGAGNNLAFEIGYARGKGKAVFAFVTDETENVDLMIMESFDRFSSNRRELVSGILRLVGGHDDSRPPNSDP